MRTAKVGPRRPVKKRQIPYTQGIETKLEDWSD